MGKCPNSCDCLAKVSLSLSLGAYQFKIHESAPLDSPVGRIKATDADVGQNAEMEYSIIEGDGLEMFGVVTDKATQEGIVTVKKVRALRCFLLVFSMLLSHAFCLPHIVVNTLVSALQRVGK